MSVTFGLTYLDVERELQGWDFDDRAADVTEWLSIEGAVLEARLRHVGYDPDEVAAMMGRTVNRWMAMPKAGVCPLPILPVLPAYDDHTFFAKTNVPHGKIEQAHFKNQAGEDKRMHVYLPPDYEYSMDPNVADRIDRDLYALGISVVVLVFALATNHSHESYCLLDYHVLQIPPSFCHRNS